MQIDTLLNEALDKIHNYTRMDINSLPPYVVDEYEFVDSGTTHVVRFLKGGAVGKRATIVTFGKRQGKIVVRKYDGVSNILKYMATVLAIFNEAFENPTQKMEQKRDGFGIIFSTKLWDKIGPKFQQIFRMKFTTVFRFNKDFNEYFEEDTQMFYFWQQGKSFKGVFNTLEKSLGKQVADATSDEADKLTAISIPTVMDDLKKNIGAFKAPPIVPAAKLKAFKKTVSDPVDVDAKFISPEKEIDPNRITVDDVPTFAANSTIIYDDSEEAFAAAHSIIDKLYNAKHILNSGNSVEKTLNKYFNRYKENKSTYSMMSLIDQLVAAVSRGDFVKSISDEEYLALVKIIPDKQRPIGLQSNKEILKETFLNDWFNTAGSEAQSLAHRVYSKVGISANLPAYYNSYDGYAADPYLHSKSLRIFMSEKLAADNIRYSINEIYKKTQEHFEEKYGKKYKTKTIKLYRGVSIYNPVAYTPGVLESWSTSLMQARKFSEATVLKIEVPLEGIFGTWETLNSQYGDFAVPPTFKKEKECIVLGGILAKIPLYRLHYGEEKPIPVGKNEMLEWILLESEEPREELMKIVTPKSPEFADLFARHELALGNEVELENSVPKIISKED